MKPLINKPTPTTGWLLLELLALVIIRVLPIFKSPLASYGYDYGFYLDAANHASQFRLADLFHNAIWGGYQSPLFLLAHWLRLPPFVEVNEIYFFAALALGLCMWLWLKIKNPLAGIFAVLLTAVSFVQTTGYLMYLWKNILALPILILGFKFLEQKKYWQLALCFLAVLILHRTTAIIFGLTLVVYFAAEMIKQKNWRKFLVYTLPVIILSAIAYFILHLQTVVLDILFNKNSYVSTGLFMEGQNFWLIWWPFLLLALPGLYLYIKKRENSLLIIFSAILLCWIVFKFPFYRRMLLYLDICLIAFAAYFLSWVDYSKKIMKIALGIIIAVFLIRSVDYTLNQQPLISAAEITEIQNFRTSPPGQFVLAVTANDAPWLLGYGKNIRLAAPGLFEDRFTYEQWQEFWQGQNQRDLLWKYPRPLYFYERTYRLQGPIAECLKPLSNNFFEYVCD